MDMNDYHMDILVRQRLDDIRADARRAVLAAALAPPRQPLRVTLGVGLMRLGRWVLGDEHRVVPAPERAPRPASSASCLATTSAQRLLLREMQRRSLC
jgi:hypothetical protein